MLTSRSTCGSPNRTCGCPCLVSPTPRDRSSGPISSFGAQDSLAAPAAKKLKKEESLVTEMGGVRLRTELDRIPLWNGNHVAIKQLAEYMARYRYLPRLRDEQVLLGAIHDGVSNMMWKDETFAYAEGLGRSAPAVSGLACRAARPCRHR